MFLLLLLSDQEQSMKTCPFYCLYMEIYACICVFVAQWPHVPALPRSLPLAAFLSTCNGFSLLVCVCPKEWLILLA